MIELNKIYNMDCLEGMKEIDDKSIDLVVTDPPYKTTKRGISENTTTGGLVRSELGKQGKIFKYNDIEIEEWLPLCYNVLKDTGHCYIMTNHRNLHNYLNVAEKIGLHFIKSLIWNKGNKIMGQSYMSQFEYILFFRKGGHKKINNCGTSDILNIPNKKQKGNDGKNLHDTEKPVNLMQLLVENSSQENEIVLDPFIGIGSTAIAAINTNRNYIGFELDSAYYKLANKRIEEHIKNKVS